MPFLYAATYSSTYSAGGRQEKDACREDWKIKDVSQTRGRKRSRSGDENDGNCVDGTERKAVDQRMIALVFVTLSCHVN